MSQMFDLPAGVRSRMIDGVNGLSMHILEAGHENDERPLALLLHGFPELAYSWRKIIDPLAAAGFHVVAPDQRGYGRTTGARAVYDQDLRPFSMLSLVDDIVALVTALGRKAGEGRKQVAMLVGHDFGSPVAGWCALTRPDVFASVVMMSAPFAGVSAPGSSSKSGCDRPRIGGVAASAQALSSVLFNARGQRRHGAGAGWVASIFAGVFSRQKCGLGWQSTTPFGQLVCRKPSCDADLLHYGPGRDDG